MPLRRIEQLNKDPDLLSKRRRALLPLNDASNGQTRQVSQQSITRSEAIRLPPPSNGAKYTAQECVDHLSDLSSEERGVTLNRLAKAGLIPVDKRQVYRRLKDAKDGKPVTPFH